MKGNRGRGCLDLRGTGDPVTIPESRDLHQRDLVRTQSAANTLECGSQFWHQDPFTILKSLSLLHIHIS